MGISKLSRSPDGGLGKGGGGGCNGLAFYLVSSRNENQDKFQVEGQFRQGADFTSLTSSSNYEGRLFTQGVTQILRDSLSEG